MADFLDEKKREIDARLKELRPLVEEFQRLEAASAALQGVKAEDAPRASRAPKRRRGAGSKRAAANGGSGRRGRPKGSGTRGAEALAIVKANPGVTIPELAEKMGIKQNYLYRVLPGLAKDGLAEKQGRGWHAKDAA
jgi:hypothetical protein